MFEYLNNAFPDVREAYRLTNVFDNPILQIVDEDGIWKQIVADVVETNRLRHYPEYDSLPPEAPFIQGDKIGEQSNLPDVIYLGKDFVMGIECFDFDSSKKTRKGSTMRSKNADALRVIQKKIKGIQRPYKLHTPVEVKLSYTNYVDSLLSAFRTHADKVARYRDALQKKYPDKKVFLTFYIEDATQVGNYIKHNGHTEAMNPLFVQEFINEIMNYHGIDYVVSCYQELYVPFLFVQKVDKNILTENLQKCYTEKDSFWGYNYEFQTITH